MDTSQPEPLQSPQVPADQEPRALAVRAWVTAWVTAATAFASAYAITFTGLYVIDSGPLLDPLTPSLLLYGGVAVLSLALVSLLSMAMLAARSRTRLAGFALIAAAGPVALVESALAVAQVGGQTIIVAALAALTIVVISSIGGLAVHAVRVTGRHRGES